MASSEQERNHCTRIKLRGSGRNWDAQRAQESAWNQGLSVNEHSCQRSV